MDKEEQDKLKKQAAVRAAGLVKSGMKLGVGTGSTVAFLIDELGRRRKEEGLKLKAVVTTSSRSKKQMEEWGFKVDELSSVTQLDLTIDGADRLAANFDGIKGGGGALTMEKNVAVNSQKVVWLLMNQRS